MLHRTRAVDRKLMWKKLSHRAKLPLTKWSLRTSIIWLLSRWTTNKGRSSFFSSGIFLGERCKVVEFFCLWTTILALNLQKQMQANRPVAAVQNLDTMKVCQLRPSVEESLPALHFHFSVKPRIPLAVNCRACECFWSVKCRKGSE